jgi:vanillate O-demethylase ferredoxin subunit
VSTRPDVVDETQTLAVAKAAWRRVRVTARRIEAKDVVSLELTPEDRASFPPFEAGAHIDVRLPGDTIRQYSLCGRREDPCFRIAVLREPKSRGGSAAVHEKISVGDVIEISQPRNLFPVVPATKQAVLIAGGIGITPIMAMAWHLYHENVPFELHYATRSKDRAAFYSELNSSPFADRIVFHFDDATPFSAQLEAGFGAPAEHRHLYVCGPGGLIDAVLRKATADAWRSDHVHREHFSAAEPPGGGQERAFEIVLARSDRRITVAADQTAVQALSAAGIRVPVSCEQGICGTCLVPVLGGVPEHRDLYMNDEEHARNDQFTPCCSRAVSDTLILDL